ncbi:Protein argonaute [Quillaja saponaria]|uniref:Protein argonaute n=1 Tax=Quillaja saponaria TaxID=32244 RepID=A0AAD7QJK7_QUISA|nr:Protein argonaute [Quillaja saponaria]
MGSNGSKCFVKANHFLMKLSVQAQLHHYNVSITPEVISDRLNRRIMREFLETYRQSHLGDLLQAYDGRKSLYTTGPLPFVSKDFEINLDKGARVSSTGRHTIAITFASHIDQHKLHLLSQGKHCQVSQEVLQALDIVMLQRLTSTDPRFISVKRSFYSKTIGNDQIGNGLEAWCGFSLTLRPIQMGLSLNVDMSAAAFVEAVEVVEFVEKLLERKLSSTRPLSDLERLKVQKALKGLYVEITHRENNEKKFCISGLTPEQTTALTFSVDKSGATEYVTDYFRKTYSRDLRYAFLPCLQVGNKRKTIYLPMECYTNKLNERQIMKLLKFNCLPPKKRHDDIVKTVKEIHYENDEYAKKFGIEVDINRSVLPAPRLKYSDCGNENFCQPQGGQWNTRNKKMFSGGAVNRWSCIFFTDYVNDRAANNFCEELANMCRKSGMEFSSRPVFGARKAWPEQMDMAITKLRDDALAQNMSLDLLIVILAENNGSLYGMWLPH